MDYAEPIINPPIFHELSSIPSLTSSMRTTTITNLTQEIHTFQPAGYRETYVTCTFKPDVAFQQRVLDMFMAATRGITDAKGVLPAVTMQPITTNTIAHFRKNGGNALGIEEGDGPLICESNFSLRDSSCHELYRCFCSFVVGYPPSPVPKGLGVCPSQRM